MRLAAAACLALAGCSPAALRGINRAGAAVAAASLAVDWCQTRSAAVERWGGDRQEGGMPAAMLIGHQPSAGAVDAYFALSSLVILGAAQAIPARYRPLAYAAIVGVEAVTVRGNLDTTRCLGIGR